MRQAPSAAVLERLHIRYGEPLPPLRKQVAPPACPFAAQSSNAVEAHAAVAQSSDSDRAVTECTQYSAVTTADVQLEKLWERLAAEIAAEVFPGVEMVQVPRSAV